MSTKTDYTFSPGRIFDTWAEYFRAYADNRYAVNHPEKPAVQQGDVEILSGVVPAHMTDIAVPKGAEALRRLGVELGFDSEILAHRERRYWNGDWSPREVVHVTGMKDADAHSAFHMKWVNNKPEEARVQINGGPREFVGVTVLKKMILEAT